jgi:hypothetical protein
LVVHCPSDGWPESFVFILEEVIDGPFFQAGDGFFWAERPRNHNDGGLGASGKGGGNGGNAVVVVQIMVAKNDVKVFEGEGVFEGGLTVDQCEFEGNVIGFEVGADDFGVTGGVFEVKDAQKDFP